MVKGDKSLLVHPAGILSKVFTAKLSLKNFSIPHELGLIILVYSLIIWALLVVSNLGMRMLSDLRAAVAGKGFWALARKEAVYKLERHITYGKEEDYELFLKNLAGPMGYRKALIEVKKDKMDYQKAAAGILEGGTHPDEIRGVTHLFHRLNWDSLCAGFHSVVVEGGQPLGQFSPARQRSPA